MEAINITNKFGEEYCFILSTSDRDMLSDSGTGKWSFYKMGYAHEEPKLIKKNLTRDEVNEKIDSIANYSR
jgi:hypothetical protein